MVVPCLVIDAYIAPGSDMTQDNFIEQINWVNFVYGVPLQGNQSPNPCRLDIRWRFRNAQGTPVMAPLTGPIVNENVFPCAPFELLDPYFQAWLNYRPTGPGPFGGTNTRDIAVYFVKGPLIAPAIGCAPFITPNGPAIVISNAPSGFLRSGQTLAHELGHTLGLAHVDDRNNLMFGGTPSLESYRLTSEQCNIVSSSPHFQSCP
ncbi:hypothetical protein P4576_08560 [Peribacillus frigoritolerans]|uniref:hypothetical protein n=1 Tax=Peribacillus frigoritolerans TaxID=450367 RepID=UPI002E1D7D27|nr:hypothetical protein [Peribacillus frigoritolerans]